LFASQSSSSKLVCSSQYLICVLPNHLLQHMGVIYLTSQLIGSSMAEDALRQFFETGWRSPVVGMKGSKGAKPVDGQTHAAPAGKGNGQAQAASAGKGKAVAKEAATGKGSASVVVTKGNGKSKSKAELAVRALLTPNPAPFRSPSQDWVIIMILNLTSVL